MSFLRPGRWGALLAVLGALQASGSAAARPQVEIPSDARTILALLWHDSPNDRKALSGLERGLDALGMRPRLRRFEAKGDRDAAVRELSQCRPENTALVIALGTEAAKLARSELVGVPLVFTAVTNPVLSGIADGWDAAGGLTAGNSNWLDRREMIAAFRLAVPDLRRLAVVRSAGNAVSSAEVAEARDAIADLEGLSLVDVVVGGDLDIPRALEQALAGADAIWVPIDFALYQDDALKTIFAAARAARVPVVSTAQKLAGLGALVTVTVDYEALGLKAASIVRRILVEGQDPGRLPVGRMSSNRIFVDIEAARAIGRQVSFDLVFRAHRVYGVKE